MSSPGDWLFKLIGIVVLTMHDYLRYWISRRPRQAQSAATAPADEHGAAACTPRCSTTT